MPTVNETITTNGTTARNEFQERIGVGSVNYALQRTGPTRTRKIIAEEGPAKGQVGGVQIDHKDGRMDAHITPATVTQSARSDI